MGIIRIVTFDWTLFRQQIRSPEKNLIAVLVDDVTKARDTGETALGELPVRNETLGRSLAKTLKSCRWYDPGDVGKCYAMDNVIYLIMSGQAKHLVGAEHVNKGVNDFVKSFDELNLFRVMKEAARSGDESNIAQPESVSVDPGTEFMALGARAFRYPVSALKSEERNPFWTDEPVYSPTYSIHSPDQSNQLINDIESFELLNLGGKEFRHQFETELVAPIKAAVSQRKAIYAYHKSG